MFKLFRKIIFSLAVVVVFCVAAQGVSAMIKVSDRISLSWPGAGATHAITFLTVEDIPPSGRIDIIPEDGGFYIPAGFDYNDVDLATSLIVDGPFADRDIASATSAVVDTVIISTSTSPAVISIILNSTIGIPPGTYVQIQLGTNASYNDPAESSIINSGTTGSYGFDLKSYDASGQLLKKSRPMLAIIEPVSMTSAATKRRLYGSPIGWLTYNTSQTIMSLITNFDARCRYSTASGTPFAAMTDVFSYAGATSTSKYHTTIINGLQNGHSYDYYVRCRDTNNVSDDVTDCYYDASTSPYTISSTSPITVVSCIDYWIPFSISGQAGSTGGSTGQGDGTPTTDTGGTGNGSGGGSGGGGSGGGSGGGAGQDRGKAKGNYLPYPPAPGAPGVILEGWAYPNIDVSISKDGAETGLAKTGANAAFGAYIADLTKGVYTFTLWAKDSAGRRSSNYSTTFWIDDGTQTTVSNIIIPPTISASQTAVNAGDTLVTSGITVPSSEVEVWMYLKSIKDPQETDITKAKGQSDAFGSWTLYVDTSKLKDGEYIVKARTNMPGLEQSGFSTSLTVSVGQAEQTSGACPGADLNKDGKVNITDFSILLYYWGTDNKCSDQNQNGKVDLTDFSIMLYYWTG